MKLLNKNIRIIAFFWFLTQGVLLLLNTIRIYYYGDNKNGIDWFFIYMGVFLIITSFLLLIKNRIISISAAIVLFLYSVFTVFVMGLLFFMEANDIFFSIILCFIIPILNTVFSILLISNKKLVLIALLLLWLVFLFNHLYL